MKSTKLAVYTARLMGRRQGTNWQVKEGKSILTIFLGYLVFKCTTHEYRYKFPCYSCSANCFLQIKINQNSLKQTEPIKVNSA